MGILTKKQRDVLCHFANNTSMHAVGNVYNSRTKCHRTMWTTLLIISVCLLFFQLYSITSKFLRRPVSTTVSVNYELPIDFPSVTICNMNPLKYNKLKNQINPRRRVKRDVENTTDIHAGDDELDAMIFLGTVPTDCPPVPKCDSTTPTTSTTTASTTSTTTTATPTTATTTTTSTEPPHTSTSIPSLPPTFRLRNSSGGTFSRKEDSIHANKMLNNLFRNVEIDTASGSSSSDANREQQLLFAMNTITSELRRELTYHPDDVMIDCTFLNKRCSLKDFVEIESARYGSCFIFNSGMNASKEKEPIRKVFGSGAGNSLTMTLYVDQGNYLPNDSPVAGYKVIIHSPDSPPIPEEEGLIVKPGQFSTMGVKLTVLKRAKKPYGRCKEFSNETIRRKNMFIDQLPFTKPTVPVCIRTCQQLEIISRCGCYSLSLGFAGAPAFNEVRRNRSYIPACIVTSEGADAACVGQVMSQIVKGQVDCKNRFCGEHVCEDYSYETSMSDGVWPAGNSLRLFKKRISLHPNAHIRRSLEKMVEKSSIYKLRDNFLKIQVYFNDLTVLQLTTEPSYQFMDLLSDIGGNVGLWLGLSVFTVFELGAFLLDMICGLYVPEDDDKEPEEREDEPMNDGHVKLEL